MRGINTIVLAIMALGWAITAAAQPNPDVESRAVNFWSGGTRLAGDLWFPKSATADDPLPAVVLCHGWGGTKSHLNSTYAPRIAAAGFYVLAFDYKGWGDSDSDFVNHGETVVPDEDGTATVEVQVIREVVDPFGQLEDIRNAIHFVQGESGVDPERIGLWGTSFGGGLVVYTAANDPRVRCVVSQVGAQDGRDAALQAMGDAGAAGILEHEQKRARGEVPPVPQGEFTFEGLNGTPHVTDFYRYRPVVEAEKIAVPVLLIDAEHEELFDRTQHSKKVHGILVANGVTTKYHVEPDIKHYGIYTERYDQGVGLAIDWFNEHLKN